MVSQHRWLKQHFINSWLCTKNGLIYPESSQILWPGVIWWAKKSRHLRPYGVKVRGVTISRKTNKWGHFWRLQRNWMSNFKRYVWIEKLKLARTNKRKRESPARSKSKWRRDDSLLFVELIKTLRNPLFCRRQWNYARFLIGVQQIKVKSTLKALWFVLANYRIFNKYLHRNLKIFNSFSSDRKRSQNYWKLCL